MGGECLGQLGHPVRLDRGVEPGADDLLPQAVGPVGRLLRPLAQPGQPLLLAAQVLPQLVDLRFRVGVGHGPIIPRRPARTQRLWPGAGILTEARRLHLLRGWAGYRRVVVAGDVPPAGQDPPEGRRPARRESSIAERERTAAERERTAAERERAADERERAANRREEVAERRERMADEREHKADAREAELDQREARQSARESRLDTLARRLGDDVPGRFDRLAETIAVSRQHLDRSEEQIRRARAALGRAESEAERDEERSDRDQESIDRETKRSERELGSGSRDRSGGT